MNNMLRFVLLPMIAGTWLAACHGANSQVASSDTLATLKGLWIGQLGSPPPVPSNRHADDPAAADLGQRFFFDARFSRNGKVSCATCHVPADAFTDKLPLAEGVGRTSRRTMPLLGAAWSPWQFWDGRKDTLWSQALGPLESPVEHGGTRTAYARHVAAAYGPAYEAVFGPLPQRLQPDGLQAAAGPFGNEDEQARWAAMSAEQRDAVTEVFVNMGKAIEAYERRLVPGPSRFDRYVEALMANDVAKAEQTLNPTERSGLKLFIGKASCIDCHNGPLFTNHEFHNTGVPPHPEVPEDQGRLEGVRLALADEFNADGRWSDSQEQPSATLRFARLDDHRDERAFKPPSLRDVAERAPYMHAGQIADLEAVIEHYDRAPAAPAGHSELHPLRLSVAEKADLAAFLRTLSAQPASDPRWLAAPTTH